MKHDIPARLVYSPPSTSVHNAKSATIILFIRTFYL